MKPLRRAAPLMALGLVLTLAAWGAAAPSVAPAESPETEANITRVIVRLLESSQFAHHRLDNELAGKFLDRYLDALDGSRTLFLQSDVQEFNAYRASLAQATRATGSTAPAHAIFARSLQRLGQHVDYITKLLRTAKFDFAGHDSFSFDRSKAERPRDLEAAQALWKEQVRAEYLQEKLAGKKPDQIATSLTKRHGQLLRTMKQLSGDEVLEIYLNALTNVYDPHSDYLGHQQMETFSIAMTLKLFGIGAVLGNEDGYCKIMELVPGGPAARSGLLKAGDRIIAVAQGNKEPTDIINMPVSRAVQLIRGPKGSAVTLTILQAAAGDAAVPKKVPLVRDEIKLEDQQAKARLLEWPAAPGSVRRLGVIDLPSFYAEMGERTGSGQRSATADVAQLLTKLNAEGVEGVVLDLRRNGGGSLEEAITLAGLFLRTGPVVQTRGPDGDVDLGTDKDPRVQYDGPMVVLISRGSASASEIVAGALQDYGRALVVGDTSTFGKGTVQNLVPLAPLMDRSGLSHTYDPGALKVTIRKFYRPSGASTQLRGVAADIVLPSLTDFSKVSESSLTDPLTWDSLPAVPYQAVNRVQPYVARLRDASAKRVAAGKEFGLLREEITLMKKNVDEESVSLNEAERRQEMAQAKARREQTEREAKALAANRPKTYEITVKNAAAPGLPAPLAPGAGNKSASATPPKAPKPADDDADPVGNTSAAADIILDESLQVLSDYAGMLSPARRTSDTANVPPHAPRPNDTANVDPKHR